MKWITLTKTIRRFGADHSGVAAVEFALFGPLLVFALLAMTDVGMAVYQRMTLDHMLRSAAHHAIEDPGVLTVQTALAGLATTESLGVWGAGEVNFHVARICACAENPALEVSCTLTCSNSQPTSIYYTIRSDLVVSGLILPSFHLQPTIQVQIR